MSFFFFYFPPHLLFVRVTICITKHFIWLYAYLCVHLCPKGLNTQQVEKITETPRNYGLNVTARHAGGGRQILRKESAMFFVH